MWNITKNLGDYVFTAPCGRVYRPLPGTRVFLDTDTIIVSSGDWSRSLGIAGGVVWYRPDEFIPYTKVVGGLASLEQDLVTPEA